MFSVILAAAMSTSGSAQQQWVFQCAGQNWCRGASCCQGCQGGCYGCQGCYGGCQGCSGCYGGCQVAAAAMAGARDAAAAPVATAAAGGPMQTMLSLAPMLSPEVMLSTVAMPAMVAMLLTGPTPLTGTMLRMPLTATPAHRCIPAASAARGVLWLLRRLAGCYGMPLPGVPVSPAVPDKGVKVEEPPAPKEKEKEKDIKNKEKDRRRIEKKDEKGYERSTYRLTGNHISRPRSPPRRRSTSTAS